MDLTSPTPPQPTPPRGDTVRGDIIWWATADHIACPVCRQPVINGSHTCKPKLLAAAGRVQRGGTIAMAGRITPRTVAEARGLLADTERVLTRRTVQGTRRWRLTLRAQSARALVTAGVSA